MTISARIEALSAWGSILQSLEEGNPSTPLALAHQAQFDALLTTASQHNPWFTPTFIRQRIKEIACTLQAEHLKKWLKPYQIPIINKEQKKTVTVIMAGNIPLVGFHDALCVLTSGHKLIAKHSSRDFHFFQFLFQILCKIQPEFEENIIFTDERPSGFDAIIATGSNNSARYFEYYFGKYPNIIRKNRNSIGIIEGNETEEAYKKLGQDIFQYFGLGCRSVAKLYVPKNYDIAQLYEGIASFQWVIDHYKYANNYEYNKTMWLMQNEAIFDNGFLLLKRDKNLSSPIGSIFYEEYDDTNTLKASISEQIDQIQCIAGGENLLADTFDCVPWGSTQEPALWEYADKVDTMAFLLQIY